MKQGKIHIYSGDGHGKTPAALGVAGTTNLKRLREIALAADIRLTREEWYQLYLSAGHILP